MNGELELRNTDLRDLVDPRSGELLPATPENAAELLQAARDIRQRILRFVKDCEAVLVDESRRQGSKTLHLPTGKVTITGGPGGGLDWNMELLERLRDLGLPEHRWDELVVATVTYKVSAKVANQLAAANPDYADVIDRAKLCPDVSWRVTVKR
jgi:hypothetical protein